MGKSSPPPPPSPVETSAAQTGTNVATAIANNAIGNVDQITPYGSLTYQQIGETTWTDPYTGQTYSAPRMQATTSLNPMQQHTLQQNQLAQGHLANTAAERAQFLEGYLGNTEAVTDQIDDKLFDLGRQRLDPIFARRDEDLRTRLSNQGIMVGTDAYDREMELLGQQENDAYNNLLLSGRNTALNEVNQPINQIIGLMSGTQVQNPNVSMNPQSGIRTTDNAALINNHYNQELGAWSQQQQGIGSTLSGVGGLFSGVGGLGLFG